MASLPGGGAEAVRMVGEADVLLKEAAVEDTCGEAEVRQLENCAAAAADSWEAVE